MKLRRKPRRPHLFAVSTNPDEPFTRAEWLTISHALQHAITAATKTGNEPQAIAARCTLEKVRTRIASR